MAVCSGPSGEALVLLSSAAAIQIARGMSAAELELLATFLQAVGENLSILALRRAADEAPPET